MVARHYGTNDELHLAFNFPPLFAPWEAASWRERIDQTRSALDARDAWPTWVLSNHDNRRHRTRYGSEARARAAAVLLLALRGTPFLYAGEELGLEDAVIPPGRTLDPGGRDGCRAPLPWDAEPGHGWGAREPWLPWPPEAEHRNVDALREDAGSILHLYRRLLAARRASPALRLGEFRWLPAPESVLVWERIHAGDRRVVALNFSGFAARVPLEPGLQIEVASDGRDEGMPYRGRIEADQALVLRPSRVASLRREIEKPGADHAPAPPELRPPRSSRWPFGCPKKAVSSFPPKSEGFSLRSLQGMFCQRAGPATTPCGSPPSIACQVKSLLRQTKILVGALRREPYTDRRRRQQTGSFCVHRGEIANGLVCVHSCAMVL